MKIQSIKNQGTIIDPQTFMPVVRVEATLLFPIEKFDKNFINDIEKLEEVYKDIGKTLVIALEEHKLEARKVALEEFKAQ